MHQPKKWWIGLPILVAIAYFAGANLTPLVEADIQARAMTRLANAPESVDKPQISVSGRDVAISGVSPEAGKRAIAELRLEPGLRKFATVGAPAAPEAGIKTAALAPPAALEPPRAAPYSFSVSLGDSVVTLSGQLPSEAVRKDALTKAASLRAGAALSDATKIEAAMPNGDYAAAIDFALASLGRLTQGRVAISDGKVSIEGQGRENVQAATIEAEARKRLPQGFELARADISAGPMSPYVFAASREGGTATLTGYAPDDSTRKRIVEAARKRFFDVAVDDRLVIAKGAPARFADAAEASLSALARLADGKISMSGANVTLSGAARYQVARAEIERSLMDGLPSGYRSDALLQTRAEAPLSVESCRAALAGYAAKPIAFAADDMSVAPESSPVMDAIAATALRCQGAAIEIGAYVDNIGIDELNRARAKRRANAVLGKLVSAGVEPSRISAVGYGAERPVAPNDSEENRARNRRVEFTVK